MINQNVLNLKKICDNDICSTLLDTRKTLRTLNLTISKVVAGQPDLTKTNMISKVWNIFKESEDSLIENTIVAAYGNTETDVKGYVSSGLPKERQRRRDLDLLQ